ncbi:MAG: hypothetical protein ACUVXJ_19320 [Phycisphaerae bacterium]
MAMMPTNVRIHVRQVFRFVLAAAGALLAAGCVQPQEETIGPGGTHVQEVARMPTEPSVVSVVAFYKSTAPWLWNVDRTRVSGIYVSALYLLGPKGLGVFGDGIIRPRMFVVETGKDGKRQARLVKEWAFNVEEAVPFRAKEKKTLGWGYGLPLPFGDLDVSGSEIQMVICFERSDGRLVTSSKQTFLVPRSTE